MMSRGMQQQEAVVSARFCPVMLVEAIDNLVGNGAILFTLLRSYVGAELI